MKKYILVTGGAGYIGSHTTKQLIESGQHVVVLDNLSTGFKQAVDDDAIFIEGDVGDGALIENLLKKYNIKDIIHFAAHLLVPESVEKPLKYYNNNVVATQNLINKAIENQVENFIFSSTCAVYGMVEEYPIDESYQLNPISPYGRSKCIIEWMLKDIETAINHSHLKSNFRYIALRYFNVAGAREDLSLGQMTENAIHLIKVCAETVLGIRKQVTIFGTNYDTEDGTCIRDYIHVDDLACAHLNALEYLKTNRRSDVFNCGYGHGYSVKQIIDVMREVSGIDFNVVEGERRAGDPPAIAADNTKIKQLLKWQPKYDDIRFIANTALLWEKKMRN